MNKLTAIYAAFTVVGCVIYAIGFMKGIMGMCIMGLIFMWTFSIMTMSKRISEIKKKLEKDKMNRLVVIYAALAFVGGVISVIGFIKGIREMCIMGFIFMWTFSIMAISERISEIEKKLEKKYKINKLGGICIVFTIVGGVICVIGFWEGEIWEMGIIGLTFMWASSIVAINERINQIEKKLKKEEM